MPATIELQSTADDGVAEADVPVLAYDGGEPPEDFEDGGGDGEPGPWVVAASFSHPMQAHVARLKLESEEIECYLDNEYLIATDWLYSNATGGVKLMVRERDVFRAKQLLAPSAVGPPEDEDSPLCPRCNSDRIYRAGLSKRLVFLSVLLLGFPVPFLARVWRCSYCGNEWRVRGWRGFEVIAQKAGSDRAD